MESNKMLMLTNKWYELNWLSKIMNKQRTFTLRTIILFLNYIYHIPGYFCTVFICGTLDSLLFHMLKIQQEVITKWLFKLVLSFL